MTHPPVELQPSPDITLFVIGLITLVQLVVWLRERTPGMAWFAGGSMACTVLLLMNALPESPATMPSGVTLLMMYAIRGAYGMGLTSQLAVPLRMRATVLSVLAFPAVVFMLALVAGFPMAHLPLLAPLLWVDLGLSALCLVFAHREPGAGYGLLSLAPLFGPAQALLDRWQGPGPFLRHGYPVAAIGFGIVVVLVCLMRSTRDSRQAQSMAQRMSNYYEALSRTNQSILRIKEPGALFEEICRICVDTGHAQLACVYLREGRFAVRVAQAGPGAALLNDIPNPWDISTPEASASLTARALNGGVLLVSRDYLNDPSSAPWRERARAHDLRTLACLPLRRADAVIGVLMLAASEVGFFETRLLTLLAEMTADISFALDSIDRDAAHLESTRQVEAGLARFTQLFQAAPVASAILTVDDRRVVAVNDAMCARHRSKREDMIGRQTTELTYTVAAEDRDLFYQVLREQGQVRNMVAQMVDHTGDVRKELMNAEPIDYLGQPCILYMSMDITDLQKAEEAREARDMAQASNRAKTEFLAHMSHELRTPLNAVLGFSALVRKEAENRLTSKELEHLEHVQQAGWHLLRLINDVLDLSRIEVGQFAIETRRLELIPVLDEALKMSSPLAADSSISLVAHYRDGRRCNAIADPTRLRQVVLNVVTNAIKYNRPEGAVHVDVFIRGDRAVIEVLDTGIGMTPRQLDQLFEPFNRLGREGHGIEGTGIGLALSRQLMQLMNGDVEVTSEPGHGTRILLSLPFDDAEPLPLPTPNAPAFEPAADHPVSGRVLYIEDNAVNMQLVEALLARWRDVQFLSAADGETGIQLAHSQSPDVILLDMQLPDMDGFDVLRRLRAHEALRRIPVIVLSATASADDITSARAAGAADYWTKPLDFNRFVNDMAKVLRAREAGDTP